MEFSWKCSEARPRFLLCALRAIGMFAVILAETPVHAAEGDPLGPQFTVNTTVQAGYLSSLGRVATAALKDGGFVVVWEDYYGNDLDVSGQRFDAKGANVGTEFSVADTSGFLGGYDIAATGLADGGFVVVWSDANFLGGDGVDVAAQRFDSAGTPVDFTFLVNATTTNDQGASIAVEVLDDGSFVVAWSDGYSDDVAGRRFSSTGTGLGTEFVVNTALPGIQGARDLDIAKLEGGGFVVAWDDYYSGDRNMFAQRFNSAGAKLGSQLSANSATISLDGDQVAVVGLQDGGFVVAWDTGSYFPLGADVAARRFDSGGTAQGSEFIVNSGQLGHQGSSSLGADGLPDGGFVIAWVDFAPGSDDVSAQRFDSAGGKVGAQFTVNSVFTGTHGYKTLDVATLKNGAFVAAWDESPGPEIAARVFEGPGCTAVPLQGCTRPSKTIIKIKDNADPTKRQLLWKWLGGVIDLSELGNPVGGSTGYALCVYDDATPAATLRVDAGGTCDGSDCWAATSTGFKYANLDTNGDGVFKMQLKSGNGNAKILVKARGENVDPAVPITQSSAVRVQLVRRDGNQCWESFFMPPATKDDPSNFKDKEDVQPECGNASVEAGEDCEVADLNGATCETLDFDGGTLACDPTCQFDTSSCFSNETVFVTSEPYDGNLGGLDGGDAICNAHAYQAGLPGIYKAWLADGTGSPSTRFTQSSQPYELVDGTLVANDWADLTDGTLQNPINRDENGTTVSSPTVVWTNVTTAGATEGALDCVDWTSEFGGDIGAFGFSTNATSLWTDSGGNGCNLTFLLYCFEQ